MRWSPARACLEFNRFSPDVWMRNFPGIFGVNGKSIAGQYYYFVLNPKFEYLFPPKARLWWWWWGDQIPMRVALRDQVVPKPLVYCTLNIPERWGGGGVNGTASL